MAVRPLTVGSARRLVVRPPPEALEVAQRRIAYERDVSPTPAVAPVRAAARHVGLAPERDDAVAAATALHEDARAIREHADSAAARYSAATEMTRPRRPVVNSTRPGRAA